MHFSLRIETICTHAAQRPHRHGFIIPLSSSTTSLFQEALPRKIEVANKRSLLFDSGTLRKTFKQTSSCSAMQQMTDCSPTLLETLALLCPALPNYHIMTLPNLNHFPSLNEFHELNERPWRGRHTLSLSAHLGRFGDAARGAHPRPSPGAGTGFRLGST